MRHIISNFQDAQTAPHTRARASNNCRSRALRVSDTTRSNSFRASSKRLSLAGGRRAHLAVDDGFKRPLGGQRVHQLKSRRRTKRPANGDRTIQLDYRRGRYLRELFVETHDARPVFFGGCVPGRGRLQSRPANSPRTSRVTKFSSAFESSQSAADGKQLIPLRSVLVEEQDGAGLFRQRGRGRVMPEFPSVQPVRGPQAPAEPSSGQNAAETRRIFTKRGTRPTLSASRGRDTFIKNEVDHRKHRRQPLCQLGALRGSSNGTRFSASVRLARTMRWATVGSGTKDRTRNLVGGQAAKQPQS